MQCSWSRQLDYEHLFIYLFINSFSGQAADRYEYKEYIWSTITTVTGCLGKFGVGSKVLADGVIRKAGIYLVHNHHGDELEARWWLMG